MKLKRPKESFADWWKRKREEEFYADMADIYGCGYFALSRKSLSLKEKRKISLKIETIIDKRMRYWGRRYKNGSGQWVHSPAHWDERNKSAIRNIFAKVKGKK